jgi:hypothetical protein
LVAELLGFIFNNWNTSDPAPAHEFTNFAFSQIYFCPTPPFQYLQLICLGKETSIIHFPAFASKCQPMPPFLMMEDPTGEE